MSSSFLHFFKFHSVLSCKKKQCHDEMTHELRGYDNFTAIIA